MVYGPNFMVHLVLKEYLVRQPHAWKAVRLVDLHAGVAPRLVAVQDFET